MTVEVRSRKTFEVVQKDVAMELHHNGIPQRMGGEGVHETSNLLSVTPWEHEAIDSFRHVGSDLIIIIKGVDTW